jgi:hypothetical protein
MGLWGFLNWAESRSLKWLSLSGMMNGLAISTKLLSAGSLVIFSILYAVYQLLINKKATKSEFLKPLIIFLSISVLIPSPWFIFSYFSTGNPVYPFFSPIYKIIPSEVNPLNFFQDLITLFLRSPDPISPIYLIVFPLILTIFSTLQKEIKILAAYCILAVILWYFTPRTGGGRFILPYLPALSILASATIKNLSEKYGMIFQNFLISVIILVFTISIGYRFMANFKYIEVISGKISKHEFLTNNLNFNFGDFYDTDNYFKDNIKEKDNVLLFGFHNLYYVNFPYIGSSWIKKGDKYNYIATQKTNLPAEFSNWTMVYKNELTHIKLYSLKEGKWAYWK